MTIRTALFALLMGVCGCQSLRVADGTCGASTPEGNGEAPVVVDKDCARGVVVESLASCLATAGPDACLAKVPGTLCDTDGDGLGDDLEDALARAYAPAFAFSGDADKSPETHFPANAAHFLSHAELRYINDDDDVLVDGKPSLDSIGAAASNGHHADNSCSGEGTDFWLCLRDDDDQTRVTSLEAMRALPDGVDVLSVVHPANGSLARSTHLFVSFSLVFPYNAHSTVGDHEGDWEGIAVFVNRQTGAIDAAYFERHNTSDNTRLVSATEFPPRDPATERPSGTMSSSFDGIHGLRFWDFSGARRHVVAYVGTGGHAMYDYPASTRIIRLGPRDTHTGDGPKLVPWSSRVVSSFGADTAGDSIKINSLNPGEFKNITLPWARFRGQWGCNDGVIGKSWPGPFGNARHQRPMFERAWGSPPRE